MLWANQIYKIDCNDGLKMLENESIDLILTDPPYGINYYSGHYKNGNPHEPIANDDNLSIPIDEL